MRSIIARSKAEISSETFSSRAACSRSHGANASGPNGIVNGIVKNGANGFAAAAGGLGGDWVGELLGSFSVLVRAEKLRTAMLRVNANFVHCNKIGGSAARSRLAATHPPARARLAHAGRGGRRGVRP